MAKQIYRQIEENHAQNIDMGRYKNTKDVTINKEGSHSRMVKDIDGED